MSEQFLALSVGLFVLLSPGFLLTLPALSLTDIINLGISHRNSGGSASLCADTTTHKECKDAAKVFRSGYTSVNAALVHTVVFAGLLFAFSHFMFQVSAQTIGIYSLLFLLLSPGIFVNIPTVSLETCGTDKNVADGSVFCTAASTGTDCKQCNKFWMSKFTSDTGILVHAIVFGVIVHFTEKFVFRRFG